MVERPFSNGTEGRAWMSVWCEECAHDHDMHIENGDGGCRIVAKSLMGRPIPEWTEFTDEDGSFFMPPAIVCSMFAQCREPHANDHLTDDSGVTHTAWAEKQRVAIMTKARIPR